MSVVDCVTDDCGGETIVDFVTVDFVTVDFVGGTAVDLRSCRFRGPGAVPNLRRKGEVLRSYRV